MIFLLFSTHSSGSTFLQNELSRFLDVPRPQDMPISKTEISLLDWGSYFVWAPDETIDFEPCRTYSPRTGEEVPLWRRNFRNYLVENASSIGRDFWDNQKNDWYTVEQFYLEQIVSPLSTQYDLPTYNPQKYEDRLEYVIDVFKCLATKGPVFGKNPKLLNDFSGNTQRLLEILINRGIPIKGIFLYRCPANTFTSMLERKFRLNEMFKGDLDQYEQFVFDSIDFSTHLGLELADRFYFFRLSYEELDDTFPDLLDFLDIPRGNPLRNFGKKYNRRYILNPRSRTRLRELRNLAKQLGYDRNDYPIEIGLIQYFSELLGTIFRLLKTSNKHVNNPETVRSVIKRSFWYEAQTSKAAPLRNIYRKIKYHRVSRFKT